MKPAAIILFLLLFVFEPCFARHHRKGHGRHRHHAAYGRRGHHKRHVYIATADDVITSRFENSKGKLAMPVEGYGAATFNDVNALPKGFTGTLNYGVNIPASSNASVHSVFEGVVSSVFATSEGDFVVIVKHGYYYTVYNGMSCVAVKKGAHVAMGEDLGAVSDNNGTASLNFQIWKAGKKNVQSNQEARKWLKM